MVLVKVKGLFSFLFKYLFKQSYLKVFYVDIITNGKLIIRCDL